MHIFEKVQKAQLSFITPQDTGLHPGSVSAAGWVGEAVFPGLPASSDSREGRSCHSLMGV